MKGNCVADKITINKHTDPGLFFSRSLYTEAGDQQYQCISSSIGAPRCIIYTSHCKTVRVFEEGMRKCGTEFFLMPYTETWKTLTALLDKELYLRKSYPINKIGLLTLRVINRYGWHTQ